MRATTQTQCNKLDPVNNKTNMSTKLKSIAWHSTKGKINLEETHVIKRLKFLTLPPKIENCPDAVTIFPIKFQPAKQRT